MIGDTHDNAGVQTFHDSYDDNVYFEMDGSHDYIADYQPTFDMKIKQVKIGYEWYDLQDLVYDPEYYLEDDYNIQAVLDGDHQEGA